MNESGGLSALQPARRHDTDPLEPLLLRIDREDSTGAGIDLHVVGANVDVEDEDVAGILQVDLADSPGRGALSRFNRRIHGDAGLR
jgi:hypothetical protein